MRLYANMLKVGHGGLWQGTTALPPYSGTYSPAEGAKMCSLTIGIFSLLWYICINIYTSI